MASELLAKASILRSSDAPWNEKVELLKNIQKTFDDEPNPVLSRQILEENHTYLASMMTDLRSSLVKEVCQAVISLAERSAPCAPIRLLVFSCGGAEFAPFLSEFIDKSLALVVKSVYFELIFLHKNCSQNYACNGTVRWRDDGCIQSPVSTSCPACSACTCWFTLQRRKGGRWRK